MREREGEGEEELHGVGAGSPGQVAALLVTNYEKVAVEQRE